MAQTKVYVGNLPFSFSSSDLEKLFAEFGTVVSSSVITDRATGQSRGFGFVEMESQSAAEEAIRVVGTKEFNGRALKVNFAQERAPRGEGGGGGRGRY